MMGTPLWPPAALPPFHAAVCRPASRLQIDGIWHSSVVVGGTEIYFGFGISMALPGTTPFGQPTHIYDLGWA